MEPEILLGVDELTVVLSPDKTLVRCLADWMPVAESIIKEFAHRANLERVFGEQKVLLGKAPQGYTSAYQYGDNPFYFAVAYHPFCPKMGVIVKFSAHSWAVYCQKGQTDIKMFLCSIQSKRYSVRLSRVDFTVDYQNWELSVDDIYHKLDKKCLEIHDHKGKVNHSELCAYETNGKVSTFYVGSRKAGTRLFLRVYDKKAEQVETMGFRYTEALNVNSWVRFEAVFKGKYAHQLINIIMETKESRLADLIADKVTEKYSFYDLENETYTDFTTALAKKSEGDFQRLRLESPRDNDLASSLIYIAEGSGLFPTLYKCDEIWGDESSKTLLKRLHDIYKNDYTPNNDVLVWLNKHKDTLEKQSFADDFELLKLLKSKKEQGLA